MSQKDKVKELVGKGLNSYHTKALQQIERIEKKNKEQNHKINILTGELDKDYITKTAEGSVISLDHSKEGMVYLDELQGNTLVNYCTDGSKELTLNGDIDAEGTFVTTTEGVDNGKVDIMCEGNTLVNLIKQVNGFAYTYYPLTIGEIYTLIIEFTSNSECSLYIEENITWANLSTSISGVKNGYNKFVVKLTIPSNYIGTEKINITNRVNGIYDGNVKFTDVKPILLKGDWTNKEMPTEYFEGMKSVGECEDNKIEILSNNGNLYKRLENSHYKVYGSTVTIIEENENGFIYKAEEWDMGLSYLISTEGLFKNKKYRLSWEGNNNTPNAPLLHSDGIKLLDSNKSFKEIISWDDFDYLEYDFKLPDSFEQGDILEIRFKNGALSVENGACNICINEIGVAKNTVISKLNKKEISLNEPLRGLPSDKRDKLVKIGGKWFVERNFKELIIDGVNFVSPFIATTGYEKTVRIGVDIQSIKAKPAGNGACVTYPYIRDSNADTEHIRLDGTVPYGNLVIWVNRSKLKSLDVVGANDYFKNNPVTVMVELATPTYEPLEVEPTLNTYNDVTHISNNSIIPCTMKIQNTGYNAIIKPNTLYTVAVDTNKGGTIGMNLGGVKGTTTNNVLKLTTPATLADDSLRLYGKGINGSKVRLLEGDKTNWIPSHFEGMKSSFEDKVQDDDTYKMEILSNNKNLINAPNMSCTSLSNGGWWNLEGNNNSMYNNIDKKTNLYFYAEKGKRYIISFDSKNLALTQRLKYQEQEMMLPLSITSNENGRYKILVIGDGLFSTFRFRAKIEDGSTPMEITNFMIIEENLYSNEFIKNKSNKIQFSSIEPLRGVGDFKDKFVFKDGKLMIERNCKVTILDETFNYTNWGNGSQDGYFTCHANNYLQGEFVFNQKNTISKEFTIGGGLGQQQTIGYYKSNPHITVRTTIASSTTEFKEWVKSNNITLLHALAEPTYEEIPFELQKIILEGYENGTLFFDTNIPPTSTVTYAGETPIVKSVKLNKTEVSNNTVDINDNILPYLMDMDYRVVMLQLATEELEGEVSMARLFGGTYEMLKRDILSKRLSRQEYGYRLADYFNAGKLTEEQVRELEELR